MSINWKHLVLSFSMVIAGTAAAPRIALAEEGHGEWKKTIEELNLTADQKKKMQEVNKGRREEMAPKRKAMKEARENLEKALKGSESSDQVKLKFSELQKVQSDFASARFAKVLAAREILTPEQRQKFKGMKFTGRGHGDEEGDTH